MVAFVVLGLPLLVLALTLATETSRPVPIAIPNAAHDGTRHADEHPQRQAAGRSISEDSVHPSGRHYRSQDRAAENGAYTEPYAPSGSPPANTASASMAASVAPATIAAGSEASSPSPLPASLPPSTQAPVSDDQQDEARSGTSVVTTPPVRDATHATLVEPRYGSDPISSSVGKVSGDTITPPVDGTDHVYTGPTPTAVAAP